MRGVVHWQATVITALAVVIAIPAGVAAGSWLFRPYVDRIGARDDIAIPLAWLGAATLTLLVLANVMAAVPARRTRALSSARLMASD